MSAPKYPDVKVQLTGEDGNIFAILGKTTKALRRAGHPEASVELRNRLMGSHSYDEALGIIMETVDVL